VLPLTAANKSNMPLGTCDAELTFSELVLPRRFGAASAADSNSEDRLRAEKPAIV
jgi:hypothetical protein